MSDLLHRLSADQSLRPSGEWFRIVAIPNLFTGEQLNIGIGVRDANGNVRVKVIDQSSRLACLYGEEGAENILFAAQIAQKAFEAGTQSPSSNIAIGTAMPFYNMAADEALNAFFAEQVSLGFTEPKRPKEKSIASDVVREQVYRALAIKAPEIHDIIKPQHPAATIIHRERKRQVIVPLQHPRAFGALESAGCRSSQTVQLRLMNALLDLEAACEARNIPTMGFFIARPTTSDEQWNLVMDNAIDDVTWRIPRHCRVEVENDPERLADRILEWLPDAA